MIKNLKGMYNSGKNKRIKKYNNNYKQFLIRNKDNKSSYSN